MAAPHPYATAPARSFWSRSVARSWDPAATLSCAEPLIRKSDKVVSAGSCFAANLVPYLERSGLTYLRTEAPHPLFTDVEPENYGYAQFSAAYGNIYTARQLLQLLKRSLNLFMPAEGKWPVGDEIVDPLRPGLRYRSRSMREFELLTAQHLRKTRQAFEQADVLVFTLGLTEAWVSKLDGTVFPACPGTVAGSFDPRLHEFKNFSAAEIAGDMDEFIRLLRQINLGIRLIVSVSPVPLVATATGGHVLPATMYSKSVLRVAAEEISSNHDRVTYFPAYEIVTGPQAPSHFFEEDKRNVSNAGVEAVMAALLAHCEVDQSLFPGGPCSMPHQQEAANASKGQPSSVVEDNLADIAKSIVARECEEAMMDRRDLG